MRDAVCVCVFVEVLDPFPSLDYCWLKVPSVIAIHTVGMDHGPGAPPCEMMLGQEEDQRDLRVYDDLKTGFAIEPHSPLYLPKPSLTA